MRHSEGVGASGIPAAAAFCLVVALAAVVGAQTVQVQPAPATPFRFVVPGMLGADVRDVVAADVRRDKLPAEVGAYVTEVAPGGPAERAGVRKGDVIVSLDGERVRSATELRRLVDETPAGRSVKVEVIREGKLTELTMKLDLDWSMSHLFPNPRWPQLPDNMQRRLRPPTGPFSVDPPDTRRPDDWSRFYYYFGPNRRTPYEPRAPRFVVPGPRLGITVQALTPQLAEYFKTRDGVLVSAVEDGSAAAFAGVRAGDIITSIDGRDVRRFEDVASVIQTKSAGQKVTLGIMRNGKPLTITATLE